MSRDFIDEIKETIIVVLLIIVVPMVLTFPILGLGKLIDMFIKLLW